ncbi:hypothetical protein N7448_007117 [Penicillium atrosanguineum]|uniref:TLC domain-containing protein n=1 Tax=Penicillium atrosanguineum TaxID=1132637 RepID=A0A9W9U2Q7_9EURO|nr:uncharacterized protein N7443_010879 [Penicillium atrosanguineum]KAJ5132959.1 hypothetical protein N7448_007117 [Penicillium atrosanguineum]KAJ5290626.1 hypothetical protein N7443_010879 [Penicillium atrosanguineum]KAJ5308449.1 hypothetical protein N7476_009105 [Penicillium atrosanguineum]
MTQISPLDSSHQEPISQLAPFAALIISIILVVLFLIRFYVLEGFLIPWLYGKTYTEMSETNRRGFINHHIAGATKFVIFLVAVYPFIRAVTAGPTVFHHPYIPGGPATLGDALIVVAQMLIGMYIFELLYRVKLSPVAVLHHVGTIMIGQSAIAISLKLAREPDANIEFILCLVWGAFDLISEFFPHIAIILYRVYPHRHYFLARIFLLSCLTTATGTLCETIVTMWLFGSLWNRWQIAFKVVTPLLHIAFSAAQIHGSLVFWRMYKRQLRFIQEEKDLEEGKDEGSLSLANTESLPSAEHVARAY